MEIFEILPVRSWQDRLHLAGLVADLDAKARRDVESSVAIASSPSAMLSSSESETWSQ
jgi:hypothetical protein